MHSGIVLIGALVALLTGFFRSSAAFQQSGVVIPDTIADVYRALLSDVHSDSRVRRWFIVEKEPIPLRVDGTWRQLMKDLPDELVQKLQAGDRSPSIAFEATMFPPGTRLIPAADIDAIFQKKDRKGWDRFAHQYPDASGYLALSVPIVTVDQHDAIAYYEYFCGSLCSGGVHVWLHYDAPTGAWTVRRQAVAWIS